MDLVLGLGIRTDLWVKLDSDSLVNFHWPSREIICVTDGSFHVTDSATLTTNDWPRINRDEPG